MASSNTDLADPGTSASMVVATGSSGQYVVFGYVYALLCLSLSLSHTHTHTHTHKHSLALSLTPIPLSRKIAKAGSTRDAEWPAMPLLFFDSQRQRTRFSL